MEPTEVNKLTDKLDLIKDSIDVQTVKLDGLLHALKDIASAIKGLNHTCDRNSTPDFFDLMMRSLEEEKEKTLPPKYYTDLKDTENTVDKLKEILELLKKIK